jgi:hypothetical protein
MPPAGYESAIPASEQPQTQTLDHVAPGIRTRKYDESSSWLRRALKISHSLFVQLMHTNYIIIIIIIIIIIMFLKD